jgi:hypothetical protein
MSLSLPRDKSDERLADWQPRGFAIGEGFPSTACIGGGEHYAAAINAKLDVPGPGLSTNRELNLVHKGRAPERGMAREGRRYGG